MILILLNSSAVEQNGSSLSIPRIIERQLGSIPLGMRLWDFGTIRKNIRPCGHYHGDERYFETFDDPVRSQWIYHFSRNSRQSRSRHRTRLILVSYDKDPSPLLDSIYVYPVSPFGNAWIMKVASATTSDLGVQGKRDGDGILWKTDKYDVFLSPEKFSIIESPGPVINALEPFLKVLGKNWKPVIYIICLLLVGPIIWLVIIGPFIVDAGIMERLIEHVKLRYYGQYEENGLRTFTQRYGMGRGRILNSYFASRELPVKFPRLTALMRKNVTEDIEFEGLKKRLYTIDRITNIFEAVFVITFLILGCLAVISITFFG